MLTGPFNISEAAPPIRLSHYAIVWAASLLASIAIDFLYFPDSLVFPDERRFLASASTLAQTNEYWSGNSRAFEMPGTAIFYSIFVQGFGPEGAVLSIRIAQALILILQSALVGLIASRIFADAKIAFLATAMTALYPFFLFNQGLLLSEPLFMALLVAAFACLYWWRDRGLQIDAVFVLTCFIFALATLTKATLLVLPPFLAAAVAIGCRCSWRRISIILLAGSLLHVAFLMPWWIRNYVLLDAFVPFTTSSSANFYLGNNPANPYAGISWRSDVETEFVERVNQIRDEIERDRMMRDTALAYIVRDPMAFIQRAGWKFLRFWNVIPNTVEYRGVYALISFLSFAPILVLAAACAFSQPWRPLLPIYVLVGYFTAVHMIVIASLRYRLPLEPFLIAMAAAPACRLLMKIKVHWSRRSSAEVEPT